MLQLRKFEALSAGTSPDAETPLSADLIEWADVIFVMEEIHRSRITARFGSVLRSKKIVVLNIPDRFAYMDPNLVKLMKSKVWPHIHSALTDQIE